MAIDTAAKRASALGFGLIASLFIIPDGTIDQGDRQTISNMYSGILATEPFPVVTPESRTAEANSLSRIASAETSSRAALAGSSSRVASVIVL